MEIAMALDEQNGYIRTDGTIGTIVTNGSSPKRNNRVIVDHPIKIGDLEREGMHEFSNRVYSPDGIARTLMGSGGNQSDKAGQYLMPSLRIRRLTPRECFRLQGFSDDDFNKAESVCSNTQLYKQAGNSICVPCVQYILQDLADCGFFGGEQKITEREGQMSFTDADSFERYLKMFKEN